jgi:uncharacterized MnhB-related membrane protein
MKKTIYIIIPLMLLCAIAQAGITDKLKAVVAATVIEL